MVDVTTLLIVGLLIGVMILAFKMMQIVFQTFMVSIVSALFYVGLVFVTGMSFSLNTMLLYSFAGSLLYLVFSIGASAYGIVSKIVSIPYKVLKLVVWKPLVYLVSKLRDSDSIQDKIETDGSDMENKGVKDDEVKDRILEKAGRK